MEFSKYEATGNDFILIDVRNSESVISGDAAANLCDRRRGIGADGVLLMMNSIQCDIRMRVLNADGSEAEMCGNGIRAFALFAVDKGITSENVINVETGAGQKKVKLATAKQGEKTLTVNMGEPSFRWSDIPMTGQPEAESIGVDLVLEDKSLLVTCVSMGNPHCVIFVENVQEYPVVSIGSQIEKHQIFPERTNVEFVQVDNTGHLIVRVWERGVGETLSCGTGACASLVAAKLNGFCEREATVTMPGGDLRVRWGKDNHVYLNGQVRHVFDGTIEFME